MRNSFFLYVFLIARNEPDEREVKKKHYAHEKRIIEEEIQFGGPIFLRPAVACSVVSEAK